MENIFKIGTITSTHGIKGEVKVFPTTDDVTRFKKLKEVILKNDKESLSLHIEGVKFFKQFVILKFKEYSDINDIERFRGYDLFVERKDAIELNDDEYYKADLINLKVIFDNYDSEGILFDIIETGANDVYVVKTDDGKEILVPAIKLCIKEVDLDKNTMCIHLMDGMVE